MENIFQSREWEKFKLATGYQKSYWVESVLILQKNLPLGFSMLYTPMVDDNLESRFSNLEFSDKIKKIAQENNSIFYRLELDIPVAKPDSKFKIPDSYKKAFEEMQPEHSLVLDLTKSLDELLSEMKQKGRYNIKIGDKNNLEISSSNLAGRELEDFYSMYEATAKRHHITYRGINYFKKLLDILGKEGYARVYRASSSELRITGHESRANPLAAAIMVYSGKTAIYMFGSSSDEHKNLMAPYSLHWQMIRDAKEMGFKYYDFFGIAPENQPHHPWAGVTRFKKQFGGQETEIMGSYDLIFKPVIYQLFKVAEKIRR